MACGSVPVATAWRMASGALCDAAGMSSEMGPHHLPASWPRWVLTTCQHHGSLSQIRSPYLTCPLCRHYWTRPPCLNSTCPLCRLRECVGEAKRLVTAGRSAMWLWAGASDSAVWVGLWVGCGWLWLYTMQGRHRACHDATCVHYAGKASGMPRCYMCHIRLHCHIH